MCDKGFKVMKDSAFAWNRILLQRVEETFPAVTERMNCTNSEKVLVAPYGETYPSSNDASQAISIKAEAVSDAEEEVDSVQITFKEIKAEPELSCMLLYVHC
ncbi:uncharacterized protein LOC111874578 isoform X4 [Cryptotermes secundus]|uniref:uncharacterized protein LOC111874578 isoform X4 n=1 Tax=Cryptotermes secundus TaxID=105785 RepID=UPI001454D8E2|nr:uncharacterized protein LOC111874578 isoform X4 [Cryptotermes secundus]